MRAKIFLIITGLLIMTVGGYFVYSIFNSEEAKKVENNDDEVFKEKEDEEDNRILTSKGYEIVHENGAYYIDGYLIVNKTYPLEAGWFPRNTNKEITASTGICKDCLDVEVFEHWTRMKSDASALGLNIYISSAYRSIEYQRGLYAGFVRNRGQAGADNVSARPGHSEHHTALAFDLNCISDAFAATNEGKWVNDNAYLYGFIIRYPKGKTDETGYKYEPWHLRYVGLRLAKELYNNGDWISMEDYFGITSEYS